MAIPVHLQQFKAAGIYRVVFDKTDEAGLIYHDGKWFMSVRIKNIYLGANSIHVDIQAFAPKEKRETTWQYHFPRGR